MAGLSLQDKLALSHTSLSQRQMAAMMGVSSRSVGRWLREGTEAGVKRIPRAYAELINFVYQWHAQESRERERRDELPPRDSDARGTAQRITNDLGIDYIDNAVVYAQRKPLPEMRRVRRLNGTVDWVPTGRPKIDPATGLPVLGNRVFIENAQFLRRELRLNALAGYAARGEFLNGSIGSDVSLAIYFYDTLGKYADMHKRIQAGKGTKISTKTAEKLALKSFIDHFGVDPTTIEMRTEIEPIFTKSSAYSYVLKDRNAGMIADALERQDNFYRERHEPSAVVGAHTLILQLGQEYASKHKGKPAGKAKGNRTKKPKT